MSVQSYSTAMQQRNEVIKNRTKSKSKGAGEHSHDAVLSVFLSVNFIKENKQTRKPEEKQSVTIL